MYHSRLSRPNQLAALPDRFAACVALGDASEGTLRAAEKRLIRGSPAMIDNGAFAAHKRGERMTLERARAILVDFEAFARIGGDLVTVVAPDVIGDCDATAALQRECAPELRALATRCRLIVPVQGADVEAAASAWAVAVETIGPGIVAGIPSKEHAWPDEQVRAFVRATGCRRVHFLGGSTIARHELAVELGLDASCDSGCAVLSAAGNAKPEGGSRMDNLAHWAGVVERRVVGAGRYFFETTGQRRFAW